MKKRSMIFMMLAAAMLASTLIAGCSAPAELHNDSSDMSVPQATAAPAEDGSAKGEGTGNAALPNLNAGNSAASGKMIIYTANIAIEAKDAAAAIKDISATATEMGGYISGSEYMEESRNAASWITVRIAPAKLGAFTARVGSLGKVLSQTLASQDVTDEYTDVQSRLRNAQAQEAQYLEIMKKAQTIDETLKVREKLNAVQQEIEQMQGQIRLMDNQVGYATVTVTIRQPPPPAVVVEKEPETGVKFWGFDAVWQKIARGFSDGFNWTLNALSAIFMVLAYAIIPLALAAGVTIGIIAIVRAVRKHGKK